MDHQIMERHEPPKDREGIGSTTWTENWSTHSEDVSFARSGQQLRSSLVTFRRDPGGDDIKLQPRRRAVETSSETCVGEVK
jgi:hypothetical protein